VQNKSLANNRFWVSLLSMRFRVSSVALVLAVSVVSFGQAAKGPEVAPGIVLPLDSDAVVFALDTGASGPVLTHVVPHEVMLATHAASNAFRSLVYAGPHITAELDSNHADTVLASAKAVFFVRLSGDDPELARGRIHLLWLQRSKKRREITDFSANVFGGQRTRAVDEVPVDTAMVKGTDWLRMTPQEPLLPGEFAVVFMPKDVNQQPSAAYDFSVPGAAAHENPYTPGTNAKSAPKE
jgi:hypothetical protein